MSAPQIASRASQCLFRARSAPRSSVSRSGLTKNGLNSRSGSSKSITQVYGVTKPSFSVQKRYIALYRTSHQPWTQYDLAHHPELSKECEERVVSAYANGDVVEAKMQFHRYRSIGVLPSTETWHKFLVQSYKDGDILEMQSLFSTLISFGVTPDAVAWNFLLDVASKQGLVSKTEEVFWAAMQVTKGTLDEFAFRAYFNCMLQEGRFGRAMVAYAGLLDAGYTVSAEEKQLLENYCHAHILERPGGLEQLVVPAEDVADVEAAFKLDSLTFSTKNVLSCSDDLSPAGRDALLTWYSKRATQVTPQQAFTIVFNGARSAWETRTSQALGFDKLRLNILRGWQQPGNEIILDADLAAELDSQIASEGRYILAHYKNDAGDVRSLVIAKGASGYNKLIQSLKGETISEAEAADAHQLIRSSKPLDFMRATNL